MGCGGKSKIEAAINNGGRHHIGIRVAHHRVTNLLAQRANGHVVDGDQILHQNLRLTLSDIFEGNRVKRAAGIVILQPGNTIHHVHALRNHLGKDGKATVLVIEIGRIVAQIEEKLARGAVGITT